METIHKAMVRADSNGTNFVALWPNEDSAPTNYRIAPEKEKEFMGYVIEPYISNVYTVHPDYYNDLKVGIEIPKLIPRLEITRDVNLGQVVTIKKASKIKTSLRPTEERWEDMAHLCMLQVKHNQECGKDDKFTKEELVDMMKRRTPGELEEYFSDSESYKTFMTGLKKMLEHITFEGERKISANNPSNKSSVVLRLSEFKNLPEGEGYYLRISKISEATLD